MSSLLNKNWILPEEDTKKPLLDRMLERRGIADIEEFFGPTWSKYLGRAGELPDMAEAVQRILKAKKDKEKVRVFGDYDADGVCATAIMYLALKEIDLDVDYRLPHRVEDGYGLSEGVLRECVDDGVKLLITVDCGVTNVKEVAAAKKMGIDVVVTDHHAVATKLPKAVAIVNPRRLENGPELVGAAVAFRVAEALITAVYGEARADQWLRWNADLVAIATVADCAPLFDENRALVHFGLKTMAANQRPGIKVLFELADTDPAKCSSEDIGFRVAPRINAAGRVAHPEDAISLLLAGNTREARQYAEKLHKLNNDRQKMTKNAVESLVTAMGEAIDQDLLIIHKSADYHPGIIGLVAGRVCERYGRPAIICEERDGLVIGSCRSVPDWHVTQALAQHADLFERFGGHAQAAGFTARKENYEKIAAGLLKNAEESLKGKDLRPQIMLEAALGATDLELRTWKSLRGFEPFGVGNETPVFYVPSAVVTESRPVGSTKAHLKMKLKVGPKTLGAIFFGGGEFADKLPVGKDVEVAATLEKHVWNGWADLELSIRDIKLIS